MYLKKINPGRYVNKHQNNSVSSIFTVIGALNMQRCDQSLQEAVGYDISQELNPKASSL